MWAKLKQISPLVERFLQLKRFYMEITFMPLFHRLGLLTRLKSMDVLVHTSSLKPQHQRPTTPLKSLPTRLPSPPRRSSWLPLFSSSSSPCKRLLWFLFNNVAVPFICFASGCCAFGTCVGYYIQSKHEAGQ